MTKKYYIVWNDDKSEGFVTDNEVEAHNVSTGDDWWTGTPGSSALGEYFRDCYYDEGDDDFEIEEVELNHG